MNDFVEGLVRDWRLISSPKQEGFDWSTGRSNWIEGFPLDSEFLTQLPNEINREKVRDICNSERFNLREKFLSVMVWGYGDRGYGPYRVTKMLEQENSLQLLEHVYQFCTQGSPTDAYTFLKENRIRNLGPSYGSKFISFCTPRELGAPIYDSFIAKWIAQFAINDFLGVNISPESWNIKMYSEYLTWIKLHAVELNCFPDEVELVIFRDAERRFAGTSGWNTK